MLCRRSKNIHYQEFFTENSRNAKNTWKGIKSIININSTMKTEPTSLMINNDLISDPKEIANTFNNKVKYIIMDKILQNTSQIETNIIFL